MGATVAAAWHAEAAAGRWGGWVKCVGEAGRAVGVGWVGQVCVGVKCVGEAGRAVGVGWVGLVCGWVECVCEAGRTVGLVWVARARLAIPVGIGTRH